jgi:hypothetical protein
MRLVGKATGKLERLLAQNWNERDRADNGRM